jgi:cyclopropane fatty-acyl-phospholipid synthase-like methyltransferase
MAGHYGANPYEWRGGTNNPHIARYFLARGWVMPGETVLDAACCTGYGSHLIGQVAEKVIGVDIDEGCIQWANNRWGEPHIDFRVADLDKTEFPDVDVTISIETAEHVQDLDHFIKQVKKHTQRMFIICVPIGGTSHAYTKEEQATPAGECNDFNNLDHLQSVFQDDTWKVHTAFQFGYSGFVVFYRKPPAVPNGYDKNAYRIGVTLP